MNSRKPLNECSTHKSSPSHQNQGNRKVLPQRGSEKNTFVAGVWKYRFRTMLHTPKTQSAPMCAVLNMNKRVKPYKYIDLFNTCLLSAYDVPGKVLSARDTARTKALLEWRLNLREQ